MAYFERKKSLTLFTLIFKVSNIHFAYLFIVPVSYNPDRYSMIKAMASDGVVVVITLDIGLDS
jgi:hypothetical protein